MYDNIGAKIKSLAKVLFILEAIIAVIIGGFILFEATQQLKIAGVLTIVWGPILAWICSWLLYGFGELIDKVGEIARNARSNERKSEAQSQIEYERIGKLEKLRSQGLITEEEYRQAISKEQ